MTMATEDSRVPVTLLTGFLGAGKTTLLNHLLRDPAAGRVAVIMNEFGDIGLDHDLVREATEEIVLMQSGCLCCTFRGDISKTLRSLMARRMWGDLAFDRVVIETTGIADPGPILHTLVVDEFVASSFRVDGVVTLADAATGRRTLEKQAEAVQQIAMADLIVVTKSDLVTTEERARFQAHLDTINTRARRVQADYGRVPAGALFGLSALRPGATPDEVDTWLDARQPEQSSLIGLAGGARQDDMPSPLLMSGGAPQARHNQRIGSASIEVRDPIQPGVFDFTLEMLMTFAGPDILRMKGIVHVEGFACPFVLHGVQHIVDAPVLLEGWSGKDTTSRIVVIARDIEKNDVKACLETLRMRIDTVKAGDSDKPVGVLEMPF
ncbi:CobW family GTP-binding protein [Rubrimonas cliftonensis]|uniref:GTPase, G3E family n=1 Tax=Rubrimonas cliftonensis TaxID=89524 RepID=A0A1H4FVW5_9RHOB|nr:GTP-binding protein [Rubrimonas cliftonensis]SEB01489.1 GTPase, G3E family [Rubrimonas cliftonensis]